MHTIPSKKQLQQNASARGTGGLQAGGVLRCLAAERSIFAAVANNPMRLIMSLYIELRAREDSQPRGGARPRQRQPPLMSKAL